MSARVGAGVDTEEESSDWIAFIINQLFLFCCIDGFFGTEEATGSLDTVCKVVGLEISLVTVVLFVNDRYHPERLSPKELSDVLLGSEESGCFWTHPSYE